MTILSEIERLARLGEGPATSTPGYTPVVNPATGFTTGVRRLTAKEKRKPKVKRPKTTATRGYTPRVNQATGFVTGVRKLTPREQHPLVKHTKTIARANAVKHKAARTIAPPVTGHTSAPHHRPTTRPSTTPAGGGSPQPSQGRLALTALETGLLAAGAFLVLVLFARRKRKR